MGMRCNESVIKEGEARLGDVPPIGRNKIISKLKNKEEEKKEGVPTKGGWAIWAQDGWISS